MYRIIAAAFLAIAAAPAAAQAPPPVAVVDHLALHVADRDASAEFYIKAFGLSEIAAPVSGPRWFDLGNGMALHIIPGRPGQLATSQSTHLAFRLQSLDPLIAYLDARKIPWQDWEGNARKITPRGDGVHQIYLRDLDGYWIEVNDAG
jgi:lactoylglutathione lyase